MKHDIQLRAVTDVNSRHHKTSVEVTLGITCDFLGINRQLIPVSCEYVQDFSYYAVGEHFNGSTFCLESFGIKYMSYILYSDADACIGLCSFVSVWIFLYLCHINSP